MEPLASKIRPKSLKEFIAWAKSYKGNLNVGVPGQGSGGYLAAQIFNAMTGVDAQLIAHSGSAPALRGLLGQEYQYAFTSAASAMGLVRSGQLRAIALSSSKRAASLPDLPTIGEALPGFAVDGWWGLVGPAKMARPLVDRLHREAVKVLHSPAVSKRIGESGGEVIGNTPEEFAKVIADDLQRYGKYLKAAPQK